MNQEMTRDELLLVVAQLTAELAASQTIPPHTCPQIDAVDNAFLRSLNELRRGEIDAVEMERRYHAELQPKLREIKRVNNLLRQAAQKERRKDDDE